MSPLAVASRVGARPSERLWIAPQDIRTADPTIAAEITVGYFVFGGKIVQTGGQSPFAIDPGGEADGNYAWARGLAGFGWLRHLRAIEQPAAGQRGRALVTAFLAAHARPSSASAWEPGVAARRMLSWLSQSPVLLASADRVFYSRFMRSLSTHHAVLARHLAGDLEGVDRLVVALALAEYGLCATEGGSLQRAGTAALAAEIDIQVLADGGHVGRNPQLLIDLLLDLLPLRHAYAARGIQAPQEVLNAIDRMMPMLRLFRHGDGALALFNGMGVTAPELVATVLAYDDTRARPVANAPYAGYQRLEARDTVVVVDAGPAPPRAYSKQAHAGCLAFELSSGINRIVVNCGAPQLGRAGTREIARATAAHATLVVDDTSSARFASGAGLTRWLGDEMLAGPLVVTVERQEDENGQQLVLSHDGYVARYGLVHHRTLALSEDGGILTGHDRLEATGKRSAQDVPYAVRFHLFPSIKARQSEEGAAIRLDVPDGEIWSVEADVPPTLEPSILFAAAGGPRPTMQIKLVSDTRHPELHWRFRRIAAGERRRR